MPSTTVHFPVDILKKIDLMVKHEKISRNKFIIAACEEALKNSAGNWPTDFFTSNLSKDDLDLLKEGVNEMKAAIEQHRKNRPGVDL